EGDERNVHAHLLVSLRKLTAEGFAAQKDTTEGYRSLPELRAAWAGYVNKALHRYGHAARADHRSLEAQGIDREPGLHMGKDATAAERKGRTSARGEEQKQIEARNNSRAALIALLRELEQLQGTPAGGLQPEDKNMAWYDRAFHTFSTVAAFPFEFIFGRGGD